MSESGWCDSDEDPWNWISQLGLNSLSDGTDGLLEMPKLTNEDLAAEHQPADKAIIAATSQAIKDFTGWNEPPLALVCESLALSLSRKGLLRQESNESAVPPAIIENHVVIVDAFQTGTEHSIKLVHIPTGEFAVRSGKIYDNGISMFDLKQVAMNDLANRKSVIRYYENQKKDSNDG